MGFMAICSKSTVIWRNCVSFGAILGLLAFVELGVFIYKMGKLMLTMESIDCLAKCVKNLF